MRLNFVYYIMEDAGSAQDMRNYVLAARELGHEVRLYGPPSPGSPFNPSADVASADAVVFIFEWTTELRYGDALDLTRLIGGVPRERRVVIDCDGAYNERLEVQGDYNHRDAESSSAWTQICESLSDKICQPTFHPRKENVRTFLFHAYDPAWEKPMNGSDKDFGMVYVGHSKFRWPPMLRVLKAVEPVRERVGRMVVVGHGWDEMPKWAKPMQMEEAYFTDKEYMRHMGLEVVQPIPSDQVIGWMSRAVFNPVIYRPLFEELSLVTCRTFETPGAATIPLFGLGSDYVEEIYGSSAQELRLPEEEPEGKIRDLFERPGHYRDVIEEIRCHLRQQHSYKTRIRDLVDIVME